MPDSIVHKPRLDLALADQAPPGGQDHEGEWFEPLRALEHPHHPRATVPVGTDMDFPWPSPSR